MAKASGKKKATPSPKKGRRAANAKPSGKEKKAKAKTAKVETPAGAQPAAAAATAFYEEDEYDDDDDDDNGGGMDGLDLGEEIGFDPEEGESFSGEYDSSEEDEDKIEESKGWELAEEAVEEEEEDSDAAGQHIYAKEYVRSLKPYTWVSGPMGRFPFTFVKNSLGLYEFYFVGPSVFGLLFLSTSIILFLVLIMVLINIFGILLHIPRQDEYEKGASGVTAQLTLRAEEMFIFRRNAATFIIFMAALIHSCIANYHLFVKRDFIAKYLTFWTEALQITKIHAGEGVFSYMASALFVQIMFLNVIIAGCYFRFAPALSGAPGFLVMLVCRIVDQKIHTRSFYPYLRIGFTFILLYVMVCGKMFILLFVFKAKVIRNAFASWNQRLDTVLNRSDDFIVRGNRLGKRTGFRELFNDHVVLLDLLEGGDVLLREAIESFFACEVGSFCFQIYYVYRAFTEKEEFQEARQMDGWVFGTMLLSSIISISLIGSSISSVSEETMEGLEILRRKGFFGRKSPEELYFLLSLYTSYNGHFETAIYGSGYSVVNKEFLLAMAGAFCVYMVILLQFSPPLDLPDQALLSQMDRQKLILNVEDTAQIFAKNRPGYLVMDYEDATGAGNTNVDEYDEFTPGAGAVLGMNNNEFELSNSNWPQFSV